MHHKKKAFTLAPPPPQQLDGKIKTQQIFFHVGYHPENVKCSEYKRKFKENILKPK